MYPYETVTQRCSTKKIFLKILQNLQEDTCAGVTFLPTSVVRAINFFGNDFVSDRLNRNRALIYQLSFVYF